MPLSSEMRRLQAKWQMNTGWPQRLDWIEIDGLRGWNGQRFALSFPIMALVGENGGGKSTVLQALASVYAQGLQDNKDRFASDFFPDTPWDNVTAATIRYAVREAGTPHENSVRKPTGRWRGNPDRRKRRVEYIDLSRIQPVSARTGYSKLANPSYREVSAVAFDTSRLARFSQILGRRYDLAKLALSDADDHRSVPVITQQGAAYSGFHQGAGETTIFELLQRDIPNHSLVLIDEIESSLHPRAQRRLMRDLAQRCRDGAWQVVLTTHSPYILEELPLEARAYILQAAPGSREFVYGVSPEFAMAQMDDVAYYECDLYVEDERSGRMLTEILSVYAPGDIQRCQVIPYGAASVGRALGQMVVNNRFPRRSCVFLDGDTGSAPGCALLPGEDAPERVVFESLKARHWTGIDNRIGRPYAQVVDVCERAMTLTNHHEWVTTAGTQLVVGGDTLWQAMTAEWAATCLEAAEGRAIAQLVTDALAGIEHVVAVTPAVIRPAMTAAAQAQAAATPIQTTAPSAEPLLPF
jgi:predicted ATPase